MSTGGVFQLITNDGRMDAMLIANELLKNRLVEIEKMRAASGMKDTTPTLVDIEKTHVLFVNAHFKPFCATAYEYNIVKPTSGNAKLGSGVEFSIPQFGDFFSDMVLHVNIASVTATNASFWNGQIAGSLNGGAVGPAPFDVKLATGAELLAYVDYPGVKIAKKVSFTVNGNPLDNYTSEVTNFHQKFCVSPNKIVGWKKLMGQQIELEGYTDIGPIPTPGVTNTKQAVSLVHGPQTPQITQPALDLWIPLLFWFNLDPRLSIPSVAIPYGQRYINVELASAAELLQHVSGVDSVASSPGTLPVTEPSINACELYINNIFVNPEIHDIFIKRIGFTLIRIHKEQPFTINKTSDEVQLNALKFPVETIYTGIRPVSQIDTTSTTLLKGWNQYTRLNTNTIDSCAVTKAFSPTFLRGAASPALTHASSLFLFLNNNSVGGLGWLNLNTEVLAAALNPASPLWGYVPTANITETWGQVNTVLTILGYKPFKYSTFTSGGIGPINATATLASITAGVAGSAVIYNALPSEFCEITYYDYTTIFTSLGVKAHGVELYKVISSTFYNAYLPFTFGGHFINTPDDDGALMVTFGLYPGSYQPNGYINISRAREFYLSYTAPLVGNSIPSANLIVIGVAMNFLLVSDGSAVLRYST